MNTCDTRHRHSLLLIIKTLNLGGAETLLVNHARYFRDRGLSVSVLFDKEHDGAIREDLTAIGCHLFGVSRAYRRLKLLRELAGRHCIVHTHSPLLAASVRLSLVGVEDSVIVHTEHNVWRQYHPLTRFANSVTYSRNRRAFAVSDVVRSSMSSRGYGQTRTLHHGIDLDSVERRAASSDERLRMELDIPSSTKVVGTIANFRPEKDYGNLISAAKLIADRASVETHFVCIGSGPTLRETQEEVARIGLEDRIHFLGSRMDAIELAADFDVFVLASRYEGLPVVLMEMSAIGLPIVVTDAGGNREIIENGVSGLCVPTSDSFALADATIKLLEQTDVASDMALQAQRRSRMFSYERSATMLLDVYDQICSCGRCGPEVSEKA